MTPMTCDLKMALAVAAETTIRPLAASVAALTKQLAVLVKRAASEKDDLATAAETLAQLKSAAGSYLTDSPGAFDRFKTNLKRTTARVETLRESIQIFDRELVPAKKAELAAARDQLQRATTAFYRDQLPACESRMADLMTQAVAERDAFVTAFQELGKVYGTSFNGPAPVACHARLDEVKHTLTGRCWLTFKAAPPISAAQAAPVAPDTRATLPAVPVPTQPASVETPPTPEVGPEAVSTSPRGAMIAPEHCAAAAECPTGAAAPLSPDANRARVLLRRSPTATETPPDPADESPAPTPLEPIPAAVCAEAAVTGTRGEGAPVENPPEAAPTDLDPDTPAPDPLPLDVEAEAPPVAGEKENPGIVAEGT